MTPFSVHLPAYEGPLELLLTIVRANRLALDNLPLAPLAAQYLAYIQQAEALDVNLSIEWVDLAARLIHWKSAALLPCDPSLPDPSDSLARDLGKELKTLSQTQLQQAAGFLGQREAERERMWTHPGPARDSRPPPAGDVAGATLWTLRQKAQSLQTLFRARRRAAPAAYEVEPGLASVEQMKSLALLALQDAPPRVWFSASSWFEQAPTLEARICLFLAILDLAGSGVVAVGEDPLPASVRLCRL